jgi:hypothetical protein
MANQLAPRPRSTLTRIYSTLAGAIDRRWGWDRLPLPLGLAVLLGVRGTLRERNLYDTSSVPSHAPSPRDESLSPQQQLLRPPEISPAATPSDTSQGGDASARRLTARTADGTHNDLSHPTMGSAGTRFGRNVPLQYTHQEPAHSILEPNPRLVSRELLTRERFIPATSLNVLAAAWLQFMIRDWFSHGKSPKENPFQIPVRDDDPWKGDRPMRVLRTRPDPTRDGSADGSPATYVNTETHWWDGSQIYGSSAEAQKKVRSGVHGKLRLTDQGMIPDAFLEPLDGEPGWWLGLALLHTLFAREHNAICDRLRADYPGWSDDDLFDHARLINAALLAKIHTVEWTPGIISHPTTRVAMRANWWGLLGERFGNLFGRVGDSEVTSGIPGSPTNHHTAPYAITEEFVAVYRMHPLTPDDFDFRSAADGRRLEERTFRSIASPHVREVLSAFSLPDLLYSFGTAHPGAVVLHNFPRFLQEYHRPDGVLQDLAATDILRSRELGVPRYNTFRELFQLKRMETFEELTGETEIAAQLRRVYGDIDRLDLTVGVFAEKRPQGFGFSDTAFRVFILMASRRLKSDRFFTVDYTPRVYTQAGLDWIADNDMSSILLRHYPALAPALRGVTNAFAPWQKLAAAEGR